MVPVVLTLPKCLMLLAKIISKLLVLYLLQVYFKAILSEKDAVLLGFKVVDF